MKKIAFLAAAVLSAASISGHLYGQDAKAQADLAGAQSLLTNPPATTSSSAFLAPDAVASTISARAIKDFKGRFTKVADEKWYLMDKGSCAYFIQGGIKIRAFYDTKGHWLASLKYCGEEQLPHLIRDVVKRTYYDFAITFVNIIEVPDHTAYLVHLEDKNSLKIVRVNQDGEMDVLTDLTKVN